jgi:hypothetical protein
MDLKTRLRNVDGESKNVGYRQSNCDVGESDRDESNSDDGESDRDDRNDNENGEDPIEVLLADIGNKTTLKKKDRLTRKKVMKREDRQYFIDDEMKEIESGFSTGCFEVAEEVPEGAKIFGLTWVYKVKPATELEPKRYRSRLCVLGNRQTEDSYGETYAAVAKVKMFRLLVSVCVHLGMKMTQLDVSNAFMYADLDRDIYVYPPPGYKHLGVLKLNKSLYGLKQAPRLWFDTMKSALEEMGFEQLQSDVCCFSHKEKHCYVLMFVDDICVCTDDEQFRSELLEKLNKKFKVKHFGSTRRYVGLQLKWSTDGKWAKIFQLDYIEKLLSVFKMTDCKIADQPCTDSVKLSKKDTISEKMKERPYRSLVGALLYLLGTRPDVTSSIRAVSQHTSNPADNHWKAAKRILRYLKGTKHKGVVYKRDKRFRLSAFCDSDHASEEDRKSISGYVVYAQGGPIVWKSKKQPIIALSTCEAEYIALSEVIKELLWTSMTLKELKVKRHGAMRVYIDNQAAKRLAENAVNHERSKHIDIRYHFIRQVVASGKVQLYYIDTKKNVSDLLTKATSRKVFSTLVGQLVQ